MFPNVRFTSALMDALIADTVTFNVADNILALVQAPPSTSPDAVLADFTLASFDGVSTPSMDPALWGIDPSNGNLIVRFTPPSGGLQFETTGVTNLPQTIYGYLVYDGDSDALWGVHVLETPVTLTAANQGFSVPLPTFTLVPGSIV